jgi:hypothetical protein
VLHFHLGQLIHCCTKDLTNLSCTAGKKKFLVNLQAIYNQVIKVKDVFGAIRS